MRFDVLETNNIQHHAHQTSGVLCRTLRPSGCSCHLERSTDRTFQEERPNASEETRQPLEMLKRCGSSAALAAASVCSKMPQTPMWSAYSLPGVCWLPSAYNYSFLLPCLATGFLLLVLPVTRRCADHRMGM
ncbi:hypothetical protein RRG08_013873 [Elysia crispata]|uniref:Uncharacterized protein n=1 Tax=Elysia crispata TaxID=231223 RepID=A0AAE1D0H7_9GAST|nr:hypothetical protein RRG08_013873 [Elysia crispata]